MPRLTPELEGEVYGELTVVVRDPRSTRTRWFCECTCGNVVIRHTAQLRNEGCSSCGCRGRSSHGAHGSRIYSIWSNMRRRCYQPKNKKYPRYGGRGVKVCEAWRLSFTSFYEDMGDPPPKTTLGRKDNDGNYCLENCRWETNEQQSMNTSQVKLITYGGVTLSHSKWSQKLGGNPDLVSKRIRRGWSEIKAITTSI